ncbi:MAG TPA: TadE/TadG family type IV pilus assembly protein [Planctomycetaceae bacterium]|nr:TadE/TadG family type IV pilus assembly protein [Planctomycetaceae bacterium]
MRSKRKICLQQLRRDHDRRGSTTVEFAVVVPVIFLLFLGSLELTALNFARQTAGNASYEAARKLIIPGGTVAQAQAEGLRQMNIVGLGNGASVTIVNTQESVTATVSVPASNVSWGLVRFCSGHVIRQSCALTKE